MKSLLIILPLLLFFSLLIAETAGTEPTYEEINDAVISTCSNITVEDNSAYSRFLHKFEMTNCSAYELTKKV